MEQSEEAPEEMQAPQENAPAEEEPTDTREAPPKSESVTTRVMQRRPSQPLVNNRRGTLASQYDDLDWEKAYVAPTAPSAAPGQVASQPSTITAEDVGQQLPLGSGSLPGAAGCHVTTILPPPLLRTGLPRGPRVGAPVQLTPYPPAGLGSCLVTTRSSSVPSARKPEAVELKQVCIAQGIQAAFRPSIAAALLQRPVQEWQEEEVIRWLLEVSLAPKELAHVIREQAITGNVLLTLTEKDFEELEIPKFGHRRLLMMAATELRAVVAHTRSKEEPLRPASGPALTVALAARGPPVPRPGQASVVAGSTPGGGVLAAPPATAKVPLVVKVFGHQRAPWGKAVAVPKVSAPGIPTCRPVMRSLSGGGLSDKSSRQSTAPFTPERGSFVPSPRDAVAAEPLTAMRTTRSLSPPMRPVVVVQNSGPIARPGGPLPKRLAWGAPSSGSLREVGPRPASKTRMQL
ncbi:mfsd2ab [Symbiodinium sp. CCMP2592]|nr:mfsd2ab [Symbiodinium sp. CCMP2592]